MLRKPLLWTVAFVALGAAPALAQEAETITTAQSDEYGTYLVDDEGMPVYLFTTDTQGQGDTKAMSSCFDDCLAAWPAVTSSAEPKAEGEAMGDMLGTSKRKDGTMQVTYNGWPLYYFAKDKGADKPQGQDKHGFGGEWYLLTPAGEKVEEK